MVHKPGSVGGKANHVPLTSHLKQGERGGRERVKRERGGRGREEGERRERESEEGKKKEREKNRKEWMVRVFKHVHT